MSKRTTADIYEVVLGIQKHFLSPFFFGLKLDPSFFENDISYKLLQETLRSIYEFVLILNKDALENQNRIISSIPNRFISKENATEIIQTFRTEKESHIDRILENLGLNGGSDFLQKIQKKWGDVELFMTLFSRFYGSDIWKKGLPNFIRIIEKDVVGSFKDLKYHVDPLFGEMDYSAVKSQISHLTPNQYGIWQSNPCRIDYIENNDSKLSIKNEHDQSSRIIDSEAAIMLDISSDRSFMKHLLSLCNDKQQMMEVCLDNIKTRSRNEVRLLISRMKSNKDKLGLTADEMRMLSEMQALNIPKKRKPGFLVFSTFTDDARLLLELGRLMDQYSCHNPNIGTHIHSLLGYALDPNTKLLLSFVINLASLPRKLAESIDGSMGLYDFDPKEMVIGLKCQGMLHALRLGKPSYRQIIRIGKSAQGTALVCEPPTIQTHFMRDNILSSTSKLISDLGIRLNASIGGNVTIGRSRAALGTYSDLAKGEQMSDFLIETEYGKIQ